MKANQITEVLEAANKIKSELKKAGPYSHNIIGITLAIIAKEFGDSAAHSLIDTCKLERHGFTKV